MAAWALCCAFLIWPLGALLGGQVFAPLIGLLAIITSFKVFPQIRPRRYSLMLLVFFAYSAASVLWSSRAFAFGEPNFLKAELALVAGGILLAAAMSLDERGRRLVLRIATWGFLVQLVIVALLTIFETQAIKLIYGNRPDDEGVQNISRNCIIMAAAAPFLIAGLIEKRSRNVAIGLTVLVLAIEIAILAKREVEAGLLALVVAGVFLAIVRFIPRYGFRIISGLVAVAVVTAPLWSWAASRGANFASATSTVDYRQIIWHRVLFVVADHPIIGDGAGALRNIKERIPEGAFKTLLVVPNHPHNMPLQLWAETGAIGAVLLAAAILLAGWRLPRPEKIGPAAPLIAALAGAMTVMGCVSFDLWNEWWWAACAFLAALIAVWARPQTPAPPAPA